MELTGLRKTSKQDEHYNKSAQTDNCSSKIFKLGDDVTDTTVDKHHMIDSNSIGINTLSVSLHSLPEKGFNK